MSRIGKKGQGTIEYIVLLAIIIVISLVVVSIISDFSGSATGITKAQSEAYWAIQKVSLLAASVDSNGDGVLRFENKTETRITITSLVVNGGTIDVNDVVLYPGEETNIVLSNLLPPCTGTSRGYNVTVNYTDAYSLSMSVPGTTPLYVECVADAISGFLTTYYLDYDRDGYGDENYFQSLSAPSGNYDVTNKTDCDDSDVSSYPGAPELCYDNADNDCDSDADCSDTTDCPSSNLMCKTPLGILVAEIVGGDIAESPEETEYGWERQVAFVVRNNSDSDVAIDSIDINGLTDCTDRSGCPSSCGTYCDGTPQMGFGGGGDSNPDSVYDPTTGVCGRFPGIHKATGLSFTGASTPAAAVITAGDLNLYSMCTVMRVVTLAPGERAGVLAEHAWPDWCIGSSWGTTTKSIGVTFNLSGSPSEQFFSDLTVTCREAVSGYSGAFTYTHSFGWGSFPAPWFPLGVRGSLSSNNNYIPPPWMHSAVGSANSNNYLTLSIVNFGTSSVDLNAIKVRGPKVNQTDNNYIRTFSTMSIAPGQIVDFNVANTTPDVYTLTNCDDTWENRTDLNIALYYTGHWSGYPASFPIGYGYAQKSFLCTQP